MTKKTLFVIVACVAVVVATIAIVWYPKTPLTRQVTQTPTSTSTQYTVQNATTTNALRRIASTSTTTGTTTTDHKGMKLYRNDEYGFEFWYPEGWEWKENVFGSPYSKFNFEVIKIDGKYTNLFDGMNIVTQDFFDNYLNNMKLDHSEESGVVIDSISGKLFRYNTGEGSLPITDVTFQLREYHVIFGVERKREKELHQILSTFKFLK
jgi:hypothetical protein